MLEAFCWSRTSGNLTIDVVAQTDCHSRYVRDQRITTPVDIITTTVSVTSVCSKHRHTERSIGLRFHEFFAVLQSPAIQRLHVVMLAADSLRLHSLTHDSLNASICRVEAEGQINAKGILLIDKMLSKEFHVHTWKKRCLTRPLKCSNAPCCGIKLPMPLRKRKNIGWSTATRLTQMIDFESVKCQNSLGGAVLP